MKRRLDVSHLLTAIGGAVAVIVVPFGAGTIFIYLVDQSLLEVVNFWNYFARWLVGVLTLGVLVIFSIFLVSIGTWTLGPVADWLFPKKEEPKR